MYIEVKNLNFHYFGVYGLLAKNSSIDIGDTDNYIWY